MRQSSDLDCTCFLTWHRPRRFRPTQGAARASCLARLNLTSAGPHPDLRSPVSQVPVSQTPYLGPPYLRPPYLGPSYLRPARQAPARKAATGQPASGRLPRRWQRTSGGSSSPLANPIRFATCGRGPKGMGERGSPGGAPSGGGGPFSNLGPNFALGFVGAGMFEPKFWAWREAALVQMLRE